MKIKLELKEIIIMKAMSKVTLTLSLILITSLFLTSCISLDYIYLDVPYEECEDANWCLPASGAMVFKYFGKDTTQQQIANVVMEENVGNVYKLINYAKDLGFEAIYNYLSIEDIKNLLKEDIPVIAIQNYSSTLPYSHARVIIGFDDEKQEVITNDPTAGKDYKISYSDFLDLNFAIKCKVVIISLK